MTSNRRPVIEGVVSSQKRIVELIGVAVLLAFGVNLLADSFIASGILGSLWIFIIGAAFCIASLVLLAVFLFKRVDARHLKMFLVYDKEDKKIIPVPRYDFGDQISEYLKAAFIENPALKSQWEKEPLHELWDDDSDKEVQGLNQALSAKLLIEAVEYYVLSLLSVHLEDYFNKKELASENLVTYDRVDIPDILLSNRFLEMFSRPMKERPAFSQENGEVRAEGKTVACYSNNAIYEEFNLVLPKNTIVKRFGGNGIEIDAKKLKMLLEVEFGGYCTVVPFEFLEYYLCMAKDDIQERYIVFKVGLNVTISIKWMSLLSWAGREYYNWVDSFLTEIEERVSQDYYFRYIGWESAYTALMCLKPSNPAKTDKGSK